MAEDPVASPPPRSNLEFKAALLLILFAALLVASVAYLMYARGAFDDTQRLVLIADAIRTTLEIAPGASIGDALRLFRRTRKHMAVVREPGGPVLGIVTLEDVLEEIVGDIEDEHDEPTPAGTE